MIRFVNGRGHLGSKLLSLLAEYEPKTSGICMVRIYHTWNVWDKSEATQKDEYDKFVKYVEEHKEEKVVFVSTYCQNDNCYVHYKQRAEAYLIANHPNGLAVRLPSIIGKKGIIQKLRDGTAQPYGELEIVSLERAAREVLKLASYEGKRRLFTVDGHKIPASVIRDLFAGTE